ncbi:hypothetical protein [Methanolobus sp. ZRKC5]|uniref:hypothetical protein n=1 Tax=unclassified Methanolobus TaxID=2629569 RepID=UPI00313E969D
MKLRLFPVLVVLLLSINMVAAEEYPYYIDNTNLTTVVDISGSSNLTLYVEKIPGYTPNGEAVYTFFENCSGDFSEWTGQIEEGTGSFTGKGKVGGVYSSSSDMARITNEQEDGFILEFDFYGVAPNSYGCSVAVGSTAIDDNTAGYLHQSSSSGQFYYNGNMFYDGVMSTWYRIKLVTSSKSNQVWYVYDMDGNLLGTSTEGTNTRSANYVKWKQNWVTSTSVYEYLDNVTIRQYTSNEPTISVTDAGTYYIIEIQNNEATQLNDYQISVPIVDIDINTTTESIKITDEAPYPVVSVSLITPLNASITSNGSLQYSVSGSGNLSTIVYIDSSPIWSGAIDEGNNTLSPSLLQGVHSWYVNASSTVGANTTYNLSDTWYFTYDSIDPAISSIDIDPDYNNIADGTVVHTNIEWSDTNLKNASFYVDYGSGYSLEESTTFSSTTEWFNTTIDTTGYTGEVISWYQVSYDEAGNSYTYSDSFNVVLNALNIYVYDETTSNSILPSYVVIYNEDISKEATISEATNISSLSYDSLSTDKYIVRVSADGYYSRNSIIYVDITSLAELNVYLPSENETVIFDQFVLTDNTGAYNEGDCIIRLDKPLTNGTDTVFSSYFDFEGITSTYLIATDQYILYIETPDRTINYGWLTPDADGVIDIVLSDSPVDLTEQWLSYSFNHDDSGVISLSYESTLEIDNCMFWVNATNGTNLYTASSATDSGSFTFTGDINSTYYVGFAALSVSGEDIAVTRLVTWSGDGVQPERLILLPEDAPDWLYNLISAGIVVVSILIFGQFRADVGCVIGAAFAGLFWYWGWLQVTGIVIAIAVIIAVSAMMHRSRRT